MQMPHPKPQARLNRKALCAGLAIAFGLSSTPLLASEANFTDVRAAQESSITGIDTLAVPVANLGPLSAAGEDTDLDLVAGISSGDDADISAQWQAMNRARAKLEAELFPEGRAPSATHTVTNCNDDGPGSLRQKIADASSGDTVDLSTLTCSTITLSGPLLFDKADLTLLGLERDNVLDLTTLQPGTGNQAGLIYHMGAGTLTVQNLRLLNGQKYGSGGTVQGGCINSSGFVVFSSSAAKYCTAKNSGVGVVEGGAIFGEQGVALVSSLITGSKAVSNDGEARGGGIHAADGFISKYSAIQNNKATSALALSNGGGVFATNQTSVDRSTISGNEASIIGGIIATSVAGDSITISHSTISGNKSTANGLAGGAFVSTDGQVAVRNSTFTRNERIAPTGTGPNVGAGLVVSGNPTLTIDSTIISGNVVRQGGTVTDSDFRSNVTSTGTGNLVGVFPSGSAPPSGAIKQIATPLESLAWNGGPTRTILPLTGSWAMNRGHFTPAMFDPDKDQRGLPRRVGAGVDIGAVESDALFVDGFNRPPLH